MYSEIADEDVRTLRRIAATCDVILTGPMGAGKTTLVNHLQRYVPLRYIAQGDITRSILEFEPRQDVIEASSKARPWDLDLVLDILSPLLLLPDTYVLDGMPRHLHEARWLLERFRERGHPVLVVALNADEEVIRRRITAPARSHRTDSDEEVAHRLVTFRTNNTTVLDILRPALVAHVELEGTGTVPMELLRQVARQYREQVAARRD